ncbi:MAG: CvpA family protein [Gammaproteobacteria bacterium]|nr:CvpA family protein [Gammaproteobacteria bacterium]MBU1646383.1 CvpA family protein [Gammaproteobacteria bacterium]MBU1970926.1 CvpA family protein [Gammaproteobacteria bacterium]
MTAFDYAVLAVMAASLLLGLWRGVVSEILALLAWVVAFVAARMLAADVAPVFGGLVPDGALRYVAGFATVFVAVLVVFSIGRLVVRLLLKAVGLGWVDRALGAVFGIARGVLIALIAVLLGGLTPLPKESWWREAMLAPPLETAIIAAKPWLPAEVSKRIRFR